MLCKIFFVALAAVGAVAQLEEYIAFGTQKDYGNILGFFANGTAWPILVGLNSPNLVTGDRTRYFFTQNTTVFGVFAGSAYPQAVYTAPEPIDDLSAEDHSFLYVVHGTTLDLVDVRSSSRPYIVKSFGVPKGTRGEPLTESSSGSHVFACVYQRDNWLSVLDLGTGSTTNYSLKQFSQPQKLAVARTEGLVAVMSARGGCTYVQKGNMYAMPDTAKTYAYLNTQQCTQLCAESTGALYVNCGSSGVYKSVSATSWASFGNQRNLADFHIIDN